MIDDGGPAFPGGAAPEDHPDRAAGWPIYDGMTLRDYFAAKAMQALIRWNAPPEGCAIGAYDYADKMLAERAK